MLCHYECSEEFGLVQHILFFNWQCNKTVQLFYVNLIFIDLRLKKLNIMKPLPVYPHNLQHFPTP